MHFNKKQYTKARSSIYMISRLRCVYLYYELIWVYMRVKRKKQISILIKKNKAIPIAYHIGTKVKRALLLSIRNLSISIVAVHIFKELTFQKFLPRPFWIEGFTFQELLHLHFSGQICIRRINALFGIREAGP